MYFTVRIRIFCNVQDTVWLISICKRHAYRWIERVSNGLDSPFSSPHTFFWQLLSDRVSILGSAIRSEINWNHNWPLGSPETQQAHAQSTLINDVFDQPSIGGIIPLSSRTRLVIGLTLRLNSGWVAVAFCLCSIRLSCCAVRPICLVQPFLCSCSICWGVIWLNATRFRRSYFLCFGGADRMAFASCS